MADSMRETLIKECASRREGYGQSCGTYTCSDPKDHGYRSCEKCGWSEPEHAIDRLLAVIAVCEQEPEFKLNYSSARNLYDYFMTAGYISPEHHPEIHKLFDNLKAFLGE